MKSFSTVLAAVLISASLASSHDVSLSPRRHHSRSSGAEESLAKRATYSGYATWYDVGTGNAGACGRYLSPNEYVVALNQPMYGDLGQKSSWCGKTITISNGKTTANAVVEDACPTGGGNCFYGSLDMSKGLFEHFADTGVGKFAITWWPAGSGGGSSSNNDDDDEDDDSEAEAAAAAAKKKAEAAAEAAKEAAAKKAAAAKEAAASAAAEASSSLAASRSSASHYSATKAAAAASRSRAAASSSRAAKASKSRARAKASKSAAAAEASESAASAAAAAEPTGNLDNFANLYGGLSKMILEQAQA